MYFLAVFAKIARRHIEHISSASVAKKAKKALFRLVAVPLSSGYPYYNIFFLILQTFDENIFTLFVIFYTKYVLFHQNQPQYVVVSLFRLAVFSWG